MKAAASEIDQEKERAKEVLREQVIGITMAAAGKIVKKEMNAENHSEILDDVVGQI